MEVNLITKDEYAQAKSAILNVLINRGAKTIDELCSILYNEYNLSEKVTKETLLRLREAGIVRPNKRWRMYYVGI